MYSVTPQHCSQLGIDGPVGVYGDLQSNSIFQKTKNEIEMY